MRVQCIRCSKDVDGFKGTNFCEPCYQIVLEAMNGVEISPEASEAGIEAEEFQRFDYDLD